MSRIYGSDPTFPYHLPTFRVAAIIRHAADAAGFSLEEQNSGFRQWLAHRTGIDARRIYGILNEEGPSVTFDTVDRILIGLDLLDLWHLPAAEGGLADYYEATEENPAPPLPEHTPEQRAFADHHNARRSRRMTERKKELEALRKREARRRTAVA